MSLPASHTEAFLTRYHEMDRNNRLRVQAICNYMEEAAGIHAAALSVGLDRMLESGLAWVLAKQRLELRRRPGPGEKTFLETWHAGVERLRFRRDFILRDEQGAVLLTAMTQWVVINLGTRRMERMPAFVADLQPPTTRHAVEDGDIRIPAPPPPGEEGAAGLSFPVRLADIDQNNHVNNVRYVDFALEAADAAGAEGELCRLDLIFRAEGLRGDVIAARSAPEGPEHPGAFIHGFYRASDGQELARARTVWRTAGG